VLPAREGHLEVPVSSILNISKTGSGEFFVLGPLGAKIMYVAVVGKSLDVRMVQPSSSLVASVSAKGHLQGLEVYGPDGKIYGNVFERSGGFCVSVRSISGQAAQDSLFIKGSVEELRLTATVLENGQPIASVAPAAKRMKSSSGDQHLEIRTQRRADTALVLCCFLGIILFTSREV